MEGITLRKSLYRQIWDSLILLILWDNHQPPCIGRSTQNGLRSVIPSLALLWCHNSTLQPSLPTHGGYNTPELIWPTVICRHTLWRRLCKMQTHILRQSRSKPRSSGVIGDYQEIMKIKRTPSARLRVVWEVFTEPYRVAVTSGRFQPWAAKSMTTFSTIVKSNC